MAATIFEHVVLFNAKDGADPAMVAAMVSGLRSLSAIDGVLYLTVVPVLRCRSSAASSLSFTHILHSRHRTKEELAAYYVNPKHLGVVQELVFPVCDNVLAVDWVGELRSGAVEPPAGSAVRLTLVKPAGDAEKKAVLAALGDVGASVAGAVVQFSWGENFSPERAQGYSLESIVVVSSAEGLEGLDAEFEVQKEKVGPLLESTVVVDFVVQTPPTATTAGGL